MDETIILYTLPQMMACLNIRTQSLYTHTIHTLHYIQILSDTGHGTPL